MHKNTFICLISAGCLFVNSALAQQPEGHKTDEFVDWNGDVIEVWTEPNGDKYAYNRDEERITSNYGYGATHEDIREYQRMERETDYGRERRVERERQAQDAAERGTSRY